jgi:protein O-mannosyl-transferase
MLLVLAAFGAGLDGSFHLDDYSILADPSLKLDATRPLTYLTFWLNYRLGAANPLGYHAVNLALHAACVLLLWDALKRIVPGAFWAAAIFAVHPFQAEPVNYVFARAILLATLFCLLSLGAWLRERHWLAAAWFLPALLSKEECAAFPLVLWLLTRSPAPRLSTRRGAGSQPGSQPAASRLVSTPEPPPTPLPWLPLAAMLLAALAAGLRVLLATRRVEGAGFHAGISPLDYFWTQGVVLLRYLRMLIAPFGFSIDPEIARAGWMAGAASWLLIALAALWSLRRGAVWFAAGLVLLLPSSSVFPVADLAADRRLYLPMTCFAVAAAQALPKWHLPVVLALAALSFGRTLVWRTEQSLWTEAARLAPRKPRPKIHLARAVGGPQALALLEEAKQMAPEDAAVASEYGATLLAQNQPARALAEFGRALALRPGDAKSVSNRGTALAALGQTAAARQDFRRALEMDPCLGDARENLKQLGETAPAQKPCP